MRVVLAMSIALAVLSACGSGDNDTIAPTPTPPATTTATHPPSPTPTVSPIPPGLSLTLQVEGRPEKGQVAITAFLTHHGGAFVSYVGGCTAQCTPLFFEPIAFEVTGPNGDDVMPTCTPGGPGFCEETLSPFAPGTVLIQALSVDGMAWEKHDQGGGPGSCSECIATPLLPGSYRVVARFTYRIGLDWLDPVHELMATTSFVWPPE